MKNAVSDIVTACLRKTMCVDGITYLGFLSGFDPGGIPMSLDYGPLKSLKERLGKYPTIQEVAREVTNIRKSKLPEPSETGSAGSFFKNPVVPVHFLQKNKKWRVW